MKKVLFIQSSVSQYGGGGVAQWLLINCLRELDHDVYTLSICGEFPETYQGKHFTMNKASSEGKFKYGFNYTIYSFVKKCIRKIAPDIIYVGQFTSKFSFLVALLGIKTLKIGIVHTADIFCHNSMLTHKKTGGACNGGIGLKCIKNKCEPPGRFVIKSLFKKIYNIAMKVVFDEFVCHSRYMETKLQHNFTNRITYIPLSFVNENYSTTEKEKKENDKLIYLFIGTLDWHKGIIELTRAFIQLTKSSSCKNHKFLNIVGSGPLKNNVNRILYENNSSNIKMFGNLNRQAMHNEIMRADVIIFPSYFETFGLVAYEAMFYKKILITSRRGALEEITEPYNNKIYLNSITSDSIIKAFIESEILYEKEITASNSFLFEEQNSTIFHLKKFMEYKAM